jgi:hypothetical protein
MSSSSFFSTSIFVPQIEFSHPSAPERAIARQEGGHSTTAHILVHLRVVSFAAATLWLGQIAVGHTELLPASARRAVSDSTIGATLVGSSPSAPEGFRGLTPVSSQDLKAIRHGRPLERSAELRALAEEAAARVRNRRNESISSWAEKIAGDVADATD